MKKKYVLFALVLIVLVVFIIVKNSQKFDEDALENVFTIYATSALSDDIEDRYQGICQVRDNAKRKYESGSLSEKEYYYYEFGFDYYRCMMLVASGDISTTDYMMLSAELGDMEPHSMSDLKKMQEVLKEILATYTGKYQ